MTSKPKRDQKPEPKPDEKWWQKGVKAFGVEAPMLLLVGVLIGIVLSYYYMFSKPDIFLQPAIAYAVRETVAVQSLSTLQAEAQTPILTPNYTPSGTSVNETATNEPSNFFGGQQLVYDDFSSTTIFTWSEGSVGKDNVGYENGVYYLDLQDPTVYFTAFLWSVSDKIVEMSDFAIQVDVLGPFYTDWEQKQGIVFGFQTDKIGNSYAFDLSYDGTCRLVNRTDDNKWEVINTSNLSDFDPNSRHTLTVIIENSQYFSGYVDEQQCLSQIIDYEPGIFGVSGKVSKTSGKLSFDNFYIFKIP